MRGLGLGGFFSKDEILAVAYERAFNMGDEAGPRREAFERIDEQVVAQLG